MEVMASSVLQLNLQKCSALNTTSILSFIQNKFFNETTAVFMTNKYRSLCHTRSLCYLTPKKVAQTKQTIFHRKSAPADVYHGLLPVIYRKYSTDPTNEDRRQSDKLPTLMDFPNIIWPSLLKTIKNWILVNFIVRPYFDQEFNMPTFVNGTKHALQVNTAKCDCWLNCVIDWVMFYVFRWYLQLWPPENCSH